MIRDGTSRMMAMAEDMDYGANDEIVGFHPARTKASAELLSEKLEHTVRPTSSVPAARSRTPP